MNIEEFPPERYDSVVAGGSRPLTQEECAAMEFVPTSQHYSWQGKYRCAHCTVSGYLWLGCVEYRYWWGRDHGLHCRKRP